MARSDEGGFAGLVIAGLVAVVAFNSSSSWVNTVWYAATFGVSTSIVVTDDRPKDCDFIHAPLGDKGCSYKAFATSYNSDGIPLSGDRPPSFGKDTATRRDLISYDGGKHWDWYVGSSADPAKITKVVVTWKRE
jgi:hypothetical protein